MSNDYDVVVVGGRVAGASVAMLLARAGVRVALVERGVYGTGTVSTHGLMRAGVLQLSRWGLLDAVVAAGTPPVRQTTFHYADGESLPIAIRPSVGVDALYAPRRQVLDRILVDAAIEAGADVRHETAVTSVLRDDSGRVNGVRARDRLGRILDLRAAITVGADGIRSTMAAQTGAAVIRRGRSATAVLYRYYGGIPTTGYEWAYGARAGAGFIPTNGGLTCVFVGAAPDVMRTLRRKGSEQAFTTLLDRSGAVLAERLSSAEPAGPMYGWAGVPGFVRRSWGPGWALVGDAGYYKDPLSTHGMTDALRDAELLADEILEASAGVVPDEVALRRYQTTRDRLSSGLLDASEGVASFAWDLTQVRGLLRQLSSAMNDEVEYLQALPARQAVRSRDDDRLAVGRP